MIYHWPLQGWGDVCPPCLIGKIRWDKDSQIKIWLKIWIIMKNFKNFLTYPENQVNNNKARSCAESDEHFFQHSFSFNVRFRSELSGFKGDRHVVDNFRLLWPLRSILWPLGSILWTAHWKKVKNALNHLSKQNKTLTQLFLLIKTTRKAA